PWLLPVLASARPPLEGELLAAVDRSMSALYELGIDHRTAMSAYLVVSGFVQGAAQLLTAEARLTHHTGVGLTGWWLRQEPRLAGAIGSGRYPWLAALARDTGAAIDLDEWFGFGLDRVLDGIAGQLSAFGSAEAPRQDPCP
ncbi:MAG: TetR/AcrR family transcriptional regulator C-terminal domain-containing protein, partial [Stackebrandtia sp.]